jgi:hypothetical protein
LKEALPEIFESLKIEWPWGIGFSVALTLLGSLMSFVPASLPRSVPQSAPQQ